MGIGGNFWDLLKPHARFEGFDFLRNKRVAVDLSYWIVQHETAIKGHARKPHIRLTFFRTINLFSKVHQIRELNLLTMIYLLLCVIELFYWGIQLKCVLDVWDEMGSEFHFNAVVLGGLGICLECFI